MYSHVTHLFKEDLLEIRESGQATVDIGGRPFTIKKQFLDDLENNPVQRHTEQPEQGSINYAFSSGCHREYSKCSYHILTSPPSKEFHIFRWGGSSIVK